MKNSNTPFKNHPVMKTQDRDVSSGSRGLTEATMAEKAAWKKEISKKERVEELKSAEVLMRGSRLV